MAKATKKQALGRGLSALLKDSSPEVQSPSADKSTAVLGSIVELDITGGTGVYSFSASIGNQTTGTRSSDVRTRNCRI